MGIRGLDGHSVDTFGEVCSVVWMDGLWFVVVGTYKVRGGVVGIHYFWLISRLVRTTGLWSAID